MATLRSQALHGLCMVLGLLRRSTRFEQSVFFDAGEGKSSAGKLSERDRKLLVWYYNHVPPGTDEATDLPESSWYSVKRRLLGPPLASEQLRVERLSKPLALGVPESLSTSTRSSAVRMRP